MYARGDGNKLGISHRHDIFANVQVAQVQFSSPIENALDDSFSAGLSKLKLKYNSLVLAYPYQ